MESQLCTIGIIYDVILAQMKFSKIIMLRKFDVECLSFSFPLMSVCVCVLQHQCELANSDKLFCFRLETGENTHTQLSVM